MKNDNNINEINEQTEIEIRKTVADGDDFCLGVVRVL
jgi:hypothetical protein